MAPGVSTLLARLGATLGFLQTYALPFHWNRGPAGRWWERVRRSASRLAGTLLDDRAGPRPITEGEFAGVFECPLPVVEAQLWAAGFVRNPLSRLKTRDGEPEVGSWVYRERPLARRQLHLMLFRGRNGTVDVYAHDELSSVNPFVGPAHLDGTRQNVRVGVQRARDRLPLVYDEAASTAPDGPWDSGRA